LHREDRAIGVDRIEMDIGMGIDEVEAVSVPSTVISRVGSKRPMP